MPELFTMAGNELLSPSWRRSGPHLSSRSRAAPWQAAAECVPAHCVRDSWALPRAAIGTARPRRGWTYWAAARSLATSSYSS